MSHKELKGCCEKCFNKRHWQARITDNDFPLSHYCKNPQCPCHQPSKEASVDELVDELLSGKQTPSFKVPSKDTYKQQSETINEYATKQDPPEDPSTWAERFDEEFLIVPSNNTKSGTQLICDPEFAKDFIRKELEQVEEKYYQPNKTVSLTKERKEGFEAGKSQALQEVVEMLEGIQSKRPVHEVGAHLYDRALADVKEAIVKLMGDKSL